MLLCPYLLLLASFGADNNRAEAFAAAFPQRVQAEVCGQPALATTVESAVEGAVRAGVKGSPELDLTFDAPICRPLFGNQKATYFVRVLATAPNRVQAAGNVAVTDRKSVV